MPDAATAPTRARRAAAGSCSRRSRVPLAILLLAPVPHARGSSRRPRRSRSAPSLRGYAKAVVRSVEDLYREKARDALGVPADGLRDGAQRRARRALRARRTARGVRALLRRCASRRDAPRRAALLRRRTAGRSRRRPTRREARAAKVAVGAVAARRRRRRHARVDDAGRRASSDPGPPRRRCARSSTARRGRSASPASSSTTPSCATRSCPSAIAAERDAPPEPLRDAGRGGASAPASPPRRRPSAPPRPTRCELPFRFVFTDQALAIEGPRAHARAVGAPEPRDQPLALARDDRGAARARSRSRCAARARATRLSQMKTEFVSNVSHELRTPLSSIRVLRRVPAPRPRDRSEEGRASTASTIEAESARLTRLVDEHARLLAHRVGPQSATASSRSTSRTSSPRRSRSSRCALRAATASASRCATPQAPLPPVSADRDARRPGARQPDRQRDQVLGRGAHDRASSSRRESGGVRLVGARPRAPASRPPSSERIFEKFYRVGHGLVHDAQRQRARPRDREARRRGARRPRRRREPARRGQHASTSSCRRMASDLSARGAASASWSSRTIRRWRSRCATASSSRAIAVLRRRRRRRGARSSRAGATVDLVDPRRDAAEARAGSRSAASCARRATTCRSSC